MKSGKAERFREDLRENKRTEKIIFVGYGFTERIPQEITEGRLRRNTKELYNEIQSEIETDREIPFEIGTDRRKYIWKQQITWKPSN